MKKIFLTGPDVFYPDAEKVMEEKKALCRKYGAEGISPLESENADPEGERMTKVIMQGNLEKNYKCDIVLANCNDFRGADMDSGTAVDIAAGYFYGKQIYGYIDDLASMKERVRKHGGKPIGNNYVDQQGFKAEPFGNPINLMPYEMILERGELIQGNLEDALKYLKQKNII